MCGCRKNFMEVIAVQYARKQYMDQLIRKKDNGRIKVITGLRRSGKSYLLFTLYRQYLLDNGVGEDQIVGLALDEIDNAKYRNPFELNKVVKERMPDKNKRYYVFIDEIQFVAEIPNPYVDDPNEKLTFIDVVLGLMKLPNADIYVTESNSKMLSSDILTQFRDRVMRFVSIRCPLLKSMSIMREISAEHGVTTTPTAVCPWFGQWSPMRRKAAICETFSTALI